MGMWQNRPKAKQGRPATGQGATRYIPASLLEEVDRLLNR